MAEETTVVEKPSHIITVDESNFTEYVNEKTGFDPEAEAKADLEKIEEEKAAKVEAEKAEADPTHDLGEHVPKKKKAEINERFSDLTNKRKAAEELAQKRADEAKTAAEERDSLRAERDALKAKYEPPKPDIATAEPLPGQFTDAVEYGKALKEWTADNTRRELAAEQENQRAEKEAAAVAKAWGERLKAAKEEFPDYQEVVGKSEVTVSDQVRDAIMESEAGPKILRHLALHPEEADRIGELTIGAAIRAIGRLEAQFDKIETKTSVAEISKAPTPITPLKNGSAAVGILRGSDEVPANMNYDEWKKRYLAGKIH